MLIVEFLYVLARERERESRSTIPIPQIHVVTVVVEFQLLKYTGELLQAAALNTKLTAN